MNHRLSLAIVACFPLLSACNQDDSADRTAQTAADAVAIVNGQPISRSEFELYLQSVARQAGEIPEERKPDLLDQFITMKLAADAAEKAGVGKNPAVIDQIELATMNVLVDAGLQKYLEENPVRDEELKPEYDAQVAAMPREYHARHILVEDQATAQGIIKDLQKGADFAKLAQQKSTDPSAQAGGDLDWFTLDAMVKPFADAVAQLEPGKITDEPVQTQFGWHVIKLEDSRVNTPPPFDDVKPQVRQLVQRKRIQTYLDELRKGAQIDKKI